jgi:hypothetical protein
MGEFTAEEARFWSKVEPTGFCWNWTKHVDEDGYGYFRKGGKAVRVHRWSYENLVGPIPDGLVLDHLCRNRRCVNPDHLEPVTRRENTLRGYTLAAAQVKRTHCPNNHEYTPANTIKNGDGKRRCRTCKNIQRRAWRAAKAGR